MNITTRGWDNITTYIPEKVFVERLLPAPSAEYSETAPSRLSIIENLLNGFYASNNYLTLFYELPEIFAPVHEIASRVSDAVWQLRAYSTDEVIYNDTDFNRLFSQPNPLNTIRQLIYQAVCYEIVTGKQFFFKNSPSTLAFTGLSSIETWSNLPGHQVVADLKRGIDPYVATTVSDFVNKYTIPREDGKKREFEVKDVLPIINFSLSSPNNINAGVSMLKGADKAVRNLIPVYEARRTIFVKRGAMGFWVSRKKDADGIVSLTPKERKDADADINSQYGITGDKMTIGVSSAPIDFVKSGMSLQELQPFEETLSDAVAIYRVLRVPRHLVPSKDNSTFSNANADMKAFYSDVIIPWAKRYADLFTTWMGVDGKVNYKRYIHASFEHLDILQENKKEKAETDKINGTVWYERWKNGAASLNQWITANGDKEINLPIYNKLLGEMTPEEIEAVKVFINLSGIMQPVNDAQT
jgi:hypothetical protein